jgi:hypothetical protein
MNASVHPFFQRCFSARVREARIGPLHLDDVITRLPTYLAYLNTDESLLFLQALPDYGTFWQQLSTMPFSENALTLLRALLELPDNNGEKARAELTKQSAMLSSDQWQTVLEDNGQHLDALLALLSRSDTVPDFGEPLAQALLRVLEKATNASQPTSDVMARWFELANALSENGRETFYKNLRDQILRQGEAEGTLSVLRAGGSTLLEVGQFTRRADEAVRLVVMPLLQQQPDGREWLKDNSRIIGVWVTNADTGTSGYLGERLGDLFGSLGEPGDTSIRALAESWGLARFLKSPYSMNADHDGEQASDDHPTA